MHRRAGKRKNSHLDDNDLIEVKLKAKKILNIGPHLVAQRILAKRKDLFIFLTFLRNYFRRKLSGLGIRSSLIHSFCSNKMSDVSESLI